MIRYSSLVRLFALLVLLLAATGCSRFKWFDKDDPLETLPVEAMYDEAKGSLQGGNLGRATRYYQRLIAQLPLRRLHRAGADGTGLCRVQGGQAFGRRGRPRIDRFIRTYPTHQATSPTLYYLRGADPT
ncbi:MAG: hypothetical protein LKM39_00120 [Chiayiivirga sp.]|jgi:outer membrane protein assembly factor BamD|nr:hypothetical protein [Chiayiivirga sp.]